MRLAGMIVAVLALAPAASSGSVHIAWNACPGTAGAASTITFNCDPQVDDVHELNATFVPRYTFNDVVAVDAYFDFVFGTTQGHASDTPPFWHLNIHGMPNPTCQPLVPVAIDQRPAGCTSSRFLCGSGGTLCDFYLTAYAWGSTINFPPNRARLLMTILRMQPPVTLGQESHFLFALHFYQSLSEPEQEFCDGCETPVGITLNQAVFYNLLNPNGREGISGVVSSGEPGSEPTVGVNCAPGKCLAVANRKSNWGRLKALYR